MRLPVLALLLPLALPVHADDGATPANGAAPPTAEAASGAAASGAPLPPAGTDAGGVPDMPTGTVYLLQEVHLTGSGFIEAILLTDVSVSSLGDCEKARSAGLTTDWTAFHPRLHNYEGLPSRLEYRCVVSDQQITSFRYNAPLDYYYLIRIDPDTSTMHMEPFRNFFTCRNARGAETKDRFCSRMSQHLVK